MRDKLFFFIFKANKRCGFRCGFFLFVRENGEECRLLYITVSGSVVFLFEVNFYRIIVPAYLVL